jgi:hypothetical protein
MIAAIGRPWLAGSPRISGELTSPTGAISAGEHAELLWVSDRNPVPC